MNNLQSVWSKRFIHYMNEVQKYMKYVFTGHLAIVMVFVIGSVGYQYSEWLKVVDHDFPAVWLIAIIIGLVLGFSRPVTLLKEPDQVYLLPVESKMFVYFKKALNWTFWSQIGLVAVVYLVSIPLLNAVTDLSTSEIWIGLLLIILLKYCNVQIEFNYRYSNRGNHVLIDRIARILLSILAVQTVLTTGFLVGLIYVILLVAYNFSLKKKVREQPIPYEHFVKLEQNRMMGFYRFANYFTDVPHLRGSIRRRSWLNSVYNFVPFNKRNTQSYLVFRTFVRTDDHFYLWVRLTAITAIIAFFVNIPIVTWIVAAALSFATTIQLKYALLSSSEFRMDMLFPVEENQRNKGVHKLIRLFMIVQAIIVMLCSIGQPLFFVSALVILIISEITFKVSKNPTPVY
ncbi:ABC-2 type transport system permease protein [Lysinibacillus composti]|uniref:ABC transporter permease n=1 Tax=Lysinibacillus composti TaxID=720633 RepID=A0A3N9UEA8_9BACI|nr:ABC transporter permease [Lysinibacillus composti]MBM7608696.1 ABC-2 type transport system permease protein [Lysinibacillus composti]RQW74609.1 ABC transporter permease [Lysinibacillus composti]